MRVDLGFRVQVWDPWSFFKLLDSDGGGFAEIEDGVQGKHCLVLSREWGNGS